MKILITGNPNYGIAKGLKKILPEADFICRSAGYDLEDMKVVEEVAVKSLSRDIFINNSRIVGHRQTQLLSKISDLWVKHNKSGKIINIGSVVDRFIRSLSSYNYSNQKNSLKHLSRQLHYCHAHKLLPFSCTYIAFGHVNTRFGQAYGNSEVEKMSVEQCAETVKWVIDNNLAIEEIRIEPVQKVAS